MKSTTATDGVKFSLIPMTEFMRADHSPEFLVKDVMVRGQPVVIGGPRKCLKTLLSLDLAFSLATATPFLGQFAVPKPVRVGFYSGESGGSTIQANARTIARAKGVSEEPDGMLIQVKEFPRLPPDKDFLVQEVEKHRLDVLFLDPAYRLFGSSASNSSNLYAMGEAYAPLNKLTEATGVTVILNHHCNKSMRDGQVPQMEDLHGAGVDAWSRQFMLINRRSRFNPAGGRHELYLTFAGSPIRGSEWQADVTEYDPDGTPRWDASVSPLSRPAESSGEKRSLGLGKVLAALKAADGPVTASKLKGLAGVNGITVKKCLEALVRDGFAVEVTDRDADSKSVTYRYCDGDAGGRDGTLSQCPVPCPGHG